MLLAVFQLDHRHQRRARIPKEAAALQGQSPQVLASEIQLQGKGALVGLINQQAPGVVLPEPAMGKIRQESAGCRHGARLHRAAEAHIQGRRTRAQRLNRQGAQPRWAPQQHLLLHQHQTGEASQGQQKWTRQGRQTALAHGSSGLSGRGMTVTSLGLTTLRGTPSTRSTAMVPRMRNQVSG